MEITKIEKVDRANPSRLRMSLTPETYATARSIGRVELTNILLLASPEVSSAVLTALIRHKKGEQAHCMIACRAALNAAEEPFTKEQHQSFLWHAQNYLKYQKQLFKLEDCARAIAKDIHMSTYSDNREVD